MSRESGEKSRSDESWRKETGPDLMSERRALGEEDGELHHSKLLQTAAMGQEQNMKKPLLPVLASSPVATAMTVEEIEEQAEENSTLQLVPPRENENTKVDEKMI